jgi:hypothetical protein
MARVSKKLTLKNVKLSYVKVAEPGDKFDGSGKEYSCQVIIDKDSPDYAALIKARNALLKEAFPKVTAGQKASMRMGVRDADEEGRSEEYDYLKNCAFFNAKRREDFGPVPCFDRRARPMVPTFDTIFSGMVANVQVTMFSFDTPQAKGVSFGLDAIQVVDNTNVDRWDGQSDPAAWFSSLEDDDKAEEVAGVEEDDDIPW